MSPILSRLCCDWPEPQRGEQSGRPPFEVNSQSQKWLTRRPRNDRLPPNSEHLFHSPAEHTRGTWRSTFALTASDFGNRRNRTQSRLSHRQNPPCSPPQTVSSGRWEAVYYKNVAIIQQLSPPISRQTVLRSTSSDPQTPPRRKQKNTVVIFNRFPELQQKL